MKRIKDFFAAAFCAISARISWQWDFIQTDEKEHTGWCHCKGFIITTCAQQQHRTSYRVNVIFINGYRK